MNVTLSPGILEEVIEHAKRAYPSEGCGLLVGRQAVDRFVPMTNVSVNAATQFEIDPAELIHTLREVRNSGEMLIAVYHSHPHGPAEPSKTDVDRAYYPEAAHLIVSLDELERPRTAAFRIIGGEILPVEIHAIV